jgi:hypothetical protein
MSDLCIAHAGDGIAYACLSPYCETMDPKCCPTVCSSRGGCTSQHLISTLHSSGLTSNGPSAYDLVRIPLTKLLLLINRRESKRGNCLLAIASSSGVWRHVHKGHVRHCRVLRVSYREVAWRLVAEKWGNWHTAVWGSRGAERA